MAAIDLAELIKSAANAAFIPRNPALYVESVGRPYPWEAIEYPRGNYDHDSNLRLIERAEHPFLYDRLQLLPDDVLWNDRHLHQTIYIDTSWRCECCASYNVIQSVTYCRATGKITYREVDYEVRLIGGRCKNHQLSDTEIRKIKNGMDPLIIEINY